MKESGVKHGDIIKFGRYYQADDSSKEDIEWRVLAIEDDKALLLSEKILDSKPYNEQNANVTWETCTLRAWLNGDFYNTAFTSEEQEQITLTKVLNDDNPWYDTNGGKDTNDKLFLLSYSDVMNPAYGFSSSDSDCDIARQAHGTVYAKRSKLYTNKGSSYLKNGYWWLRSPGGNPNYADFVGTDGLVHEFYTEVNYSFVGVRPTLWLNL